MYGMPYYSYNQEGYEGFDANNDYGMDNMNYMDSPGPSSSKFDRNDGYGYSYGNYHKNRGGYGPARRFGPPHEMELSSGPYMPYQQNDIIRPLMAPEELVSGWIRGYGPQCPTRRRLATEDNFFRRLLRCGVPKENLKDLPRELLQILEPEHCGLCAHSFEKPSEARLHYLSKHHEKNQKKWIKKHLDAFPLSNETPLKSRNLYCELCDIHITSKQHADSHYAGKQHRSIVEGRRDPRNSALLHPKRQGRLKQLIKREKALLKPVTVNKVATKPIDTKDAPPDLCCQICKTVVTCSEQMTMHLNGKKHLSKEKQYILRMMMGQGEEKDDKATDNQETSQDTKETGEDEKYDDNDEENAEEQNVDEQGVDEQNVDEQNVDEQNLDDQNFDEENYDEQNFDEQNAKED